jgi:hypothetical protein
VITDSFGKLFNDGGELVAEGSCQVDHEKGSVTLRPIVDTPLLSRQEGVLRLVLDDGGEFQISDRIIRFRLNVPGVPYGPAYRLYMLGAPGLRSTGSGGEMR